MQRAWQKDINASEHKTVDSQSYSSTGGNYCTSKFCWPMNVSIVAVFCKSKSLPWLWTMAYFPKKCDKVHIYLLAQVRGLKHTMNSEQKASPYLTFPGMLHHWQVLHHAPWCSLASPCAPLVNYARRHWSTKRQSKTRFKYMLFQACENIKYGMWVNVALYSLCRAIVTDVVIGMIFTDWVPTLILCYYCVLYDKQGSGMTCLRQSAFLLMLIDNCVKTHWLQDPTCTLTLSVCHSVTHCAFCTVTYWAMGLWLIWFDVASSNPNTSGVTPNFTHVTHAMTHDGLDHSHVAINGPAPLYVPALLPLPDHKCSAWITELDAWSLQNWHGCCSFDLIEICALTLNFGVAKSRANALRCESPFFEYTHPSAVVNPCCRETLLTWGFVECGRNARADAVCEQI